MTNPKIPEWLQAAIAKLNEKYDEKRQQFKQQGNSYYDGFADGLDAAETIFMREFECAEPQSAWISVADRLPENECDVLIFIKHQDIQYIGVGAYDLSSKHWVDVYGRVTHWHPLPEPPKASE